MERLAQIEVQLIMNYLTRVELALFSRCSRRLLSDGDTDLAWSTQPLYELPNICVSLDQWLSHVSTPATKKNALLMRHAGFSLTLTQDILLKHDVVEHVTRLFDSLSLIRLEQITFRLSDPSFWWELFTKTPFPHLREIYFDCSLKGLKMSQILLGFQQSSKLRVLSLPYGLEWHQIDSVLGLRAFPLLTNLTFSDARLQAPQKDEDETISIAIMKCEFRLTHLHIKYSTLSAHQFNHVFTSPQMSQLKDFTIRQWTWLDENEIKLSMDLLSSTWSCLTSLERLSIIQIKQIKHFLPTLASLGSKVELLEITTYTGQPNSAFYPPSNCLHDLLTSHPHLFIQFSTYDQDTDSDDSDDEYHRELPVYKALNSETKKRLQVILM